MRVISIIVIFLVSSIPGLLFQLIAHRLGLELFGPETAKPLYEMLWLSIPSTLLTWVVVGVLYLIVFRIVARKHLAALEIYALNAVVAMILSHLGFALNWLISAVIAISFGWTTLEYLDLFGGVVIMLIWGLPPGLLGCGILFLVTWLSKLLPQNQLH